MIPFKKRSGCPISCSLDIWGDKWSLLIIRDLMFHNQCSYGDFLKSEEKIATNILASKLNILQESGIISKSEHPDNKSKVLYKLTNKGIDLIPILIEINLWGDKYLDLSDNYKNLAKLIKKNKEGFLKRSVSRLKKML